MKKRCYSCEQFKNKKFFSFKNKQKGIRNTECKSCKAKYNKKWYKKNKDNHIINASKNKKDIVTKI